MKYVKYDGHTLNHNFCRITFLNTDELDIDGDAIIQTISANADVCKYTREYGRVKYSDNGYIYVDIYDRYEYYPSDYHDKLRKSCDTGLYDTGFNLLLEQITILSEKTDKFDFHETDYFRTFRKEKDFLVYENEKMYEITCNIPLKPIVNN